MGVVAMVTEPPVSAVISGMVRDGDAWCCTSAYGLLPMDKTQIVQEEIAYTCQ